MRANRRAIAALLTALVCVCTVGVAVTPVSAAPNNTISGVVTDGDNAVPAAGLEVRLYREPGRVVVANRTTAADGTYSFAGVEDGSYRLRVADPASGVFRTEFFQDAYAYDAATAINVTGGASIVRNMTVARPNAVGGTITDEDTGLPVPGIEVRLYREPGRVVVGNRITDASGAYLFDQPGPGSYRIRLRDPAGTYVTEHYADVAYYNQATPITVAAGQTVDVDGQISAPTQITGTVTDADTTAPLAGIEVRLFREPGRVVVANAITAANGTYAFTNPGAGTYRIRFSDPVAGVYPTEFWDDAATYATGDDIVLAAGGSAVASATLTRPSGTFAVTTAVDGPDAVVDGVCEATAGLGDCTLRAALTEANAHPGHDLIQIGADIDPVLAIPGTDEDGNATGDLDVSSAVTIEANGATVDAAQLDRVIDVHLGGDLVLTDATIRGGLVEDPDDGEGPGARVIEGRARLESVTVTDSPATFATVSLGASGTLELVDSTVLGTGNESGGAGGLFMVGVVETWGGSLVVERSTIAADPNTTPWFGVHVGGGTTTMDQSTVVGSGTGIYLGESGEATPPSVTITRSTIDASTTDTGIVAEFASTADVRASTVVGHDYAIRRHSGSTVTVQGSVLDGVVSCNGAITSLGWNVYPDAGCFTPTTGDQPNADVLLHPLGANGGPTDTHLPYANSANVDAIPIGTPGLCDGGASSVDQRNAARPAGAACDAGAVEGSSAGSALPTEFDVDTDTDAPDAAPGDGVCDIGDGTCSLRAAITEANLNPSPDSIVLAPGLEVTLTIPGAGEDANATGDLDASGDLTILGAGATVDGGGLDRVLDHSWGTLTVVGLTVRGGDVVGDGGGLRTNWSTLSLDGATIVGNTATADGGGVKADRTAGTTITETTITANTATRGGGVFAQGEDVQVASSTISGNTASSVGGGVALSWIDADITTTTISGNEAAGGSAVSVSWSGPTMAVHLTQVSIVGNVGGPALSGGIVDNPAMTLSGSVIDGNGFGACTPGVRITAAHVVVTDGSCTITGSDVTAVPSAMLLPLADNGGPTATRLPAAGSALIDAIPVGTPGLCDGTVPADQRGEPRPAGAGCDLGAVEGVGPSVARTFTVDTAEDAVDAAPGDGVCDVGDGSCSLRAALTETNQGIGTDRIEVAAGIDPTLSLPGSGEDANATGDLDVLQPVEIVGNGATIDAGGLDRVLDVRVTVLTISDATVTGGSVSGSVDDGGGIRAATGGLHLDGVTVAGNTMGTGSNRYGAGISVELSSLTVRNSTIGPNASTGTGTRGIGLAARSSDVTLESTDVTGNTTTSSTAVGIGAYAAGGTLTITDSSLIGNGAGATLGSGGGLYASVVTLDIADTEISGNAAASAAGLSSGSSGPTTVTRTRIVDNTAASANGGGLLSGPVTVDGSVVSGNSAPAYPGLRLNGPSIVRRSTIAGNTSAPTTGSLQLAASSAGLVLDASTVVSGSPGGRAVAIPAGSITASTIVSTDSGVAVLGSVGVTVTGSLLRGGHLGAKVCSTPLTSGGWNAASDDSCGLTATGDHPSASLPLGPVADNGGPTPTVLPSAGSVGIDAIPAGTPGLCDDDQRGVVRPVGAGCDIGAVEGAGPAWPPGNLVVSTASDLGDADPADGVCDIGDGTCSLRAAIDEANRSPVPMTISFAAGKRPAFTVDAADEDLNTSGDLDIWTDLVIDGNGMSVDANQLDRVFHHHAGALELRELTIRRGRDVLSGAGIRTTGTSLLLDEMTLVANWADYAGAISSWRVPVTILDSTIRTNGALDGYASAIEIDEAPLVMQRVWLTGNNDAPDGVTVDVGKASVDLDEVVIVDNIGASLRASLGATAEIRRSTFGRNAVSSTTTDVDIAGAATIEQSTFVDRDRTALKLTGGGTVRYATIVGGLQAGAATDVQASLFDTCTGAVTGAHNLSRRGQCGASAVDPLLWPLPATLGPDLPVASPAAGSPALDAVPAGTAGLCDGTFPTDAVGTPRPTGSGCAAGAVEAAGPAAVPVTFTVDTATDAPDATPEDGSCDISGGSCSLRAAFAEADAHPGPDTIEIADGIDPVVDYLLPDELAAEPLVATSDLVLHGNGATISSGTSSGSAVRLFELFGAGVELHDLTLTGARGGAIAMVGGITRLDGVVIDATGPSLRQSGAGINAISGGTIELVESTVRGNRSGSTTTTRQGAAINAVGATVVIDRSTFFDNTATGPGGAIAVSGGSLTIRNSTFSGNSASAGSAISATSAAVSITASTLYANPGTTTLAVPSAATITGTIVMAWGGSVGCAGTVTSGGYNLDYDSSCGLSGTGDVQGVDAWLGTLSDNGGPTLTHAPVAGSVAIDAIPLGTPGLCDGSTPTDQRGVGRPQSGSCDIGAVEHEP